MIPKCSNLVQGINFGYPISDMVLVLKSQRSTANVVAWNSYECLLIFSQLYVYFYTSFVFLSAINDCQYSTGARLINVCSR